MTEVLTEQTLFQKSPQELTAILYDACIEKLEKASLAIKQKDFETANQLLQNCNDILYRLGAGLNYEAGIIADQLEVIYTYMAERLIEANLKKNTDLIAEVTNLLKMLSESWKAALQKGTENPTAVLRKRASVYDQDLFYDQGAVDRKE
ncbi:flagellar export chaperone FliS [Brevibacillus borstelensis]|uniref:flagellar export chaperone FliS n=1 Tax=Brevibacillus borstelensis TaxID=45462 RepID=UPI002E1A7E82|nr:flagellar export chaperone FliS [Brevibacillus borstelensis]MED1872987.1 flagellar export chaperone FliS [Brevibacillus borstelensis]